MPYAAHYTATGADVRFSGTVTELEIATALVETARHSYAGGRRYALVDHTETARCAVTSQGVLSLAEMPEAYAAAGGPLAVAIVVPSPEAYALARSWEEHVRSRRVVSAVLRTRSMALAWLAARGIPEAELPPDGPECPRHPPAR